MAEQEAVANGTQAELEELANDGELLLEEMNEEVDID